MMCERFTQHHDNFNNYLGSAPRRAERPKPHKPKSKLTRLKVGSRSDAAPTILNIHGSDAAECHSAKSSATSPERVLDVHALALAMGGSSGDVQLPEDKRLAGDRHKWSALLPQRAQDKAPALPAPLPSAGDQLLTDLLDLLQTKLQPAMQSDPVLEQAIANMQHALKNVPSVTKIPEHFDQQMPVKANTPNSHRSESQVNVDKVYTDVIHKQLEDSALKLESSVYHMEMAISKMKAEKEEMEKKLKEERNVVRLLKKQLKNADAKADVLESAVRELNKEKLSAEQQLQLLKEQLGIRNGFDPEEVRGLIKRLNRNHMDAETENFKLSHDLTLSRLENEKMKILLASRDKQIAELRTDLVSMQAIIDSQLYEMREEHQREDGDDDNDVACSSHDESSEHDTPPQPWNGQTREQLQPRRTPPPRRVHPPRSSPRERSTHLADLAASPDLKPNAARVRTSEVPVRDVAQTTEDSNSDSNRPSYSSKTKFQDMFAELKRQAMQNLDITLPLPPRPFESLESGTKQPIGDSS